MPPDDVRQLNRIRKEIEECFGERLAQEPDGAYLQGFDFQNARFVGLAESNAQSEVVDEGSLKVAVELDPSNTSLVELWFARASNSQDVIDFYNKFRTRFKKTTRLYHYLTEHLVASRRYADALRAADAARRLAQRDGILHEIGAALAQCEAESLSHLGRSAEAVNVLRNAIASYSGGSAACHYLLSSILFRGAREGDAARGAHLIAECAQHALLAVELSPMDTDYSRWACFLTGMNNDSGTSLRLAKRYLSLATSVEEKCDAHICISNVYSRCELYEDAITQLRQAMALDDMNAEVISDLAHCYYMVGRGKDAERFAKRCLVIDPNNEGALQILQYLGD